MPWWKWGVSRPLFISAEGRALPCMALSGMDIQEECPLIPEIGLPRCITDSRYMRLIDTRATEVLRHNPECQTCISPFARLPQAK